MEAQLAESDLKTRCFGNVTTMRGMMAIRWSTHRTTNLHTHTSGSTCHEAIKASVFYLHLGCQSHLLVITPILGHIHTSSSLPAYVSDTYTVVTNHPSGTAILRSGWQSTHAYKYRLMPFSTKGLGCITVRQVWKRGGGGGLWPDSDKHGQRGKQVTSQIRMMYLG